MKQWQLYPLAPSNFVESFANLSPLVLQLLFNREIVSPADIDCFLSGTLVSDKILDVTGDSNLSFYNPFLFRDMEASVEMIINCIKQGQKIIVYGDYDADGVTSSVVLLEALQALQAKVEVYLPDRVSEGYGLNKKALDQLSEQGASLIITVDNGIRNKAEVIYAQEKGLQVIITDHHVLPDNREDLPPCLIINPADKEDLYPWSFLAGVGVSFKLVSALVHKSKLSLDQKKVILEKSLDMVAVGTIADMVSLQGENRLLVIRGLDILNQGRRLGLRELLSVAKINVNKKLEAWNVGWQIGPRLNAASRLGHANNAFSLLTVTDASEAQEMALALNQRNIDRQKITEEIIAQVEQQIDRDNLPAIIIGSANVDQAWNEGVIGLVAGRICEKYYRPTLIITRVKEDDLSELNFSFKASGRSIPEFNLIAAITAAKEHLDKFGGHPMACGFSVGSEERLEKFKVLISEIAQKQLQNIELSPKLKIEAEIKFGDLNFDLVSDITKLAPFGQNNPQPRFVSYCLRIDDVFIMGADSQHLKLRLSSDDYPTAKGIWCLAFNATGDLMSLRTGELIDVVYYLDINDFNGRQEIQMKLIDLKKSDQQ